MPEPRTVYASMVNPAAKLDDERWGEFVVAFYRAIRRHGEITGEWYSCPDVPWQNVAARFQITPDAAGLLKSELAKLAADYELDAPAWDVIAETDEKVRAKAFEAIGAKLDEFADASCCGGIRECADPDCAWSAGYISGLAAARVVVRGATPDQPIEKDDNKPGWRERARARVGDRVDARMEELMAEPPMSADEFDEAMRRNKAEAEAHLNRQSHAAFGEQP